MENHCNRTNGQAAVFPVSLIKSQLYTQMPTSGNHQIQGESADSTINVENVIIQTKEGFAVVIKEIPSNTKRSTMKRVTGATTSLPRKLAKLATISSTDKSVTSLKWQPTSSGGFGDNPMPSATPISKDPVVAVVTSLLPPDTVIKPASTSSSTGIIRK